HVGARHDAIADTEGYALAVEHLAAECGDAAHILMTADQRIGEVALMRGAGILLALTAEGVLVGAADSRIAHLHKHGTRSRIRHRKFLNRYPAGSLHDGSANSAHLAPPPWDGILSLRDWRVPDKGLASFTSTSTRPSATLAGKIRTRTFGSRIARPVRRSNSQPCHGQASTGA